MATLLRLVIVTISATASIAWMTIVPEATAVDVGVAGAGDGVAVGAGG